MCRGISNLTLVNPEILEISTQNLRRTHLVFPGIPQEPFYVGKTSTVGLGVNVSTIQANCLCRLPQRKPMGTLIVAVIIADFVILQMIWKPFLLIVNMIGSKQHPDMRYCEGCIASYHHQHHDHNESTDEPACSEAALRSLGDACASSENNERVLPLGATSCGVPSAQDATES